VAQHAVKDGFPAPIVAQHGSFPPASMTAAHTPRLMLVNSTTSNEAARTVRRADICRHFTPSAPSHAAAEPVWAQRLTEFAELARQEHHAHDDQDDDAERRDDANKARCPPRAGSRASRYAGAMT
jgi:hypothetical protein